MNQIILQPIPEGVYKGELQEVLKHRNEGVRCTRLVVFIPSIERIFIFFAKIENYVVWREARERKYEVHVKIVHERKSTDPEIFNEKAILIDLKPRQSEIEEE